MSRQAEPSGCAPAGRDRRADRAGAWRRVNGGRGPRSTRRRRARGALLASAALWFSGPALARAADAVPQAGEAITAFDAVEGWIRAWRVPASPEASGDVDPRGASGAAVTLRLAGRVIGRGSVIDEAGDTVRRAALAALVEADATLEPTDDPPTGQAALEREHALAQRITIRLEIAGPLRALGGETFADAARALSPGVHGSAMAVGASVAAVFPATQLATGIEPTAGLRVAAGRLGLDPVELASLRRRAGAEPLAFRSVALAQTEPAAEPVFLHRGGRIVGVEAVDAEALRDACRAMADHIIALRWPGPEPFGLRGTLDPTTGRSDPLIAEPSAQAACAYALARHAESPWLGAARRAHLRAEARAILSDLTRVAPDEADPLARAATAGGWLAAAARLGIDGDDPLLGFAHAAERRALRGVNDDAAWRTTPAAERALVALGLAEWSRAGPAQAGSIERASGAVRSVFRDTPPEALVSAMPWLGWAEIALAGDRPVPATLALVQMRDLAWTFQASADSLAPHDLDLAGGVVFASTGERRPTWRTLRPIAFLATALGRDELTANTERPAQVARQRDALRFLLQLLPAEHEAHMYRSGAPWRGGVRAAAWDQRQAPQATALGLLAASETLRSLTKARR